MPPAIAWFGSSVLPARRAGECRTVANSVSKRHVRRPAARGGPEVRRWRPALAGKLALRGRAVELAPPRAELALGERPGRLILDGSRPSVSRVVRPQLAGEPAVHGARAEDDHSFVRRDQGRDLAEVGRQEVLPPPVGEVVGIRAAARADTGVVVGLAGRPAVGRDLRAHPPDRRRIGAVPGSTLAREEDRLVGVEPDERDGPMRVLAMEPHRIASDVLPRTGRPAPTTEPAPGLPARPESTVTNARPGAIDGPFGPSSSRPPRGNLFAWLHPWAGRARPRRRGRGRGRSPPDRRRGRRPGRRLPAVRLAPGDRARPRRQCPQRRRPGGDRGRGRARGARRLRRAGCAATPRPAPGSSASSRRRSIPAGAAAADPRRFAIDESVAAAADRAPLPARHRHLRRLPARGPRPGRPALPLSVHQLHELRPAGHDHRRAARTTGPGPRCGTSRSARPAPRSTPTRRTAASTPSRSPARPAARGWPTGRPTPPAPSARDDAALAAAAARPPGRADRRGQGPRRLPPRLRRDRRGGRRPAARPQAPLGQAVRGHGRATSRRSSGSPGSAPPSAACWRGPSGRSCSSSPAAAASRDSRPRSPPATTGSGVFLPYTPLHHLLLAAVGRPIVLTSRQPLRRAARRPTTPTRAERLAGLADAFLVHDRRDPGPLRRLGHPRGGRAGLDRAARARLRPRGRCRCRSPAERPILAVGAELKHTFTLARGRRAHVGPAQRRPGGPADAPGVHRRAWPTWRGSSPSSRRSWPTTSTRSTSPRSTPSAGSRPSGGSPSSTTTPTSRRAPPSTGSPGRSSGSPTTAWGWATTGRSGAARSSSPTWSATAGSPGSGGRRCPAARSP